MNRHGSFTFAAQRVATRLASIAVVITNGHLLELGDDRP